MPTARRTRYGRTLARLYALQARGVRLGRSRMAQALAHRGHPERGQRFVHVAGTNGKGSVSAMIAACLSAAGHRTGLFTSPHLHRYVERIRIDGRCISDREAERRIRDVLDASAAWGDPESTFFELTTLLALESFRDHGCDVSVLEVGLGGRLDATNAVTPELCVITRIALDHTQILGSTIAKVAAEKAGILKPGVPAIVGVRDAVAKRVIARRARAVGAAVSFIDDDFGVERQAGGRASIRVGERVLRGLPIALAGAHQLDNLACAVAALCALRERGFAVPARALAGGLARVRWPARLERIAGRPRVLLDAAHNPDGAAALAAQLRASRPRGPRVLVFGAMSDKDHGAMLRALAPCCEHVVLCRPRLPRAASFAELRAHGPAGAARSLPEALARARRMAGTHGEVVVAGSIFLVAEARARLLDLPSDPPIRM